MYDPSFIGPPPNPPAPPPMLTPPNPQKQLKNQKRDVRRKEGTVAKQVLTGTPPISGASTVPTSPLPANAPAPTPPFNGSPPSALDKIPQMSAPPAPPPVAAPPPPSGTPAAAEPTIPGLIRPGNINLNTRPVVPNADGSYSTVRSITITDDQGRAILIPTVVGGKVVSNQDAVAHYRATGQNLGVFANEAAANAYAQQLHNQQAAQYGPQAAARGIIPPPAPNRSMTPLPANAPAPTPPFNGSPPSALDKIPQMSAPTAPIPQYTPPVFHQPQYEPPKKGLEYLALGLGLLFPGAPIARIAAGFAGGLGQGAEAKYQRAEKAAEQQYNVSRDQAQASYQNQQTAYNADLAEQKRKFGNEQVTYAAAQEARARGIDPTSGKPFPIPTVEQLLPRGKPPSYQDYANAYRQRAEAAVRFGASELVKQYTAQAEDYNREAIAEANIQRAMAVAAMNARARLQAASISASTRLQAAAISASAVSGREAQRERFEVEMLPLRAAVQATAQQRMTYRQDAGRYMSEFSRQYMKDFYSSPGKDDKGHALPPALNGQQSSIAHMTQIIGRSSDPMAAAEWLSKYVANPNAQGLLLTFGQAQDAQMKALGKMPGGFKAPDIPALSKQQREALAKLGQGAEQTVLSQLLGGSSLKDVEDLIRSSKSPDKDLILEALQGKHAAPPTPHVNMNEIMESLEAGAAAGG